MNKLLSCLVLICTSFSGSAQTITQDLLNKFEDEERVECIVVMNDQLDLYGKTEGMTKDKKATFVYQSLKAHAAQSQRLLQIHYSLQNIESRSFFAFNGTQAWLTLEQAKYIASHFDVDRILPNVQTRIDRPIAAENNVASVRMDAEWGIMQINADKVWELGIRGEGVIVAGQDTGYDFDNPAILSKYQGYSEDTIIHDYSWHDAIHELNPLNEDADNDPANNPCGLNSSEPCDDNSHGSHTMGTMVGGNDTLKIGVAPDAKWIACRNMDRGFGSPVTYTECFEWFLAPTDINGNNPDPTKAPHVINNSWGCPPVEGCNPENFFMMETVVNNLTAAGTVVVASAGNDGTTCGIISNPTAIFENTFTVGASRFDDSKAIFSSIGPVLVDSSYRIKPDVVAPGIQVLSINNSGGFNSWGGTSMAGPHVAGAIALIISANPDLAGQVDVIKDILKSTAVSYVDSMQCGDISALDVPNFHFGYGRIDVLAAVEMALNLPCEIEAGDDIVLCHDLDEAIDTLNGQIFTGNIVSYAWSTEPRVSALGNITHASDMLSDTTVLRPEVGRLDDSVRTFYLTATSSNGSICIDSVKVYSTFWIYTLQDPASGILQGDTTGMYSNASSNWPMSYAWSPNYNISDITAATPSAWPDTSQYYNLLVSDSIGCQVETGWKVNVGPNTCMIDAGEDLIICSEEVDQDIILNGQLISEGITHYEWSSESSTAGSFTYHGSDMMSDTTILNPTLTDHFEPTEVYYLTGYQVDGSTCVDSVTVNFSDWMFVAVDPISGKTIEDTVGIYSIAESNWPSDYLWSPDYNISDVTDYSPDVWNDTTQYYNLLITDSLGCTVETGWLVNVLTASTHDENQLIEIEVSPNPNQGVFTLSTTEEVIKYVEIFDVSGKRISIYTGNSNSMTIEGLGNGTYVYRASVGDKLAIGKVVVLRK